MAEKGTPMYETIHRTMETYNGWTNRETWATKLHLDNDQVLQEVALDYTRIALQDEQEGGVTAYALGEQLESWITDDLLTLENIAGNQGLFNMLTDIGSLYRVNWQEIAQAYIDEVKENEKVSA
jgi:hypothetical protein